VQACNQWNSSWLSTFLTSSHCKSRPNTEGLQGRAGTDHELCHTLLNGLKGYKAELALLTELVGKVAHRFLNTLHTCDPPLSVEVFASSWLLCLFTTTFPTETALRVLDATAFDGLNVIVCVAASFVHIHEDDLLAVDDAYESLDLLRELATHAMDADAVMEAAKQMLTRFPAGCPLLSTPPPPHSNRPASRLSAASL
jgi:hypothetical protein